MKFEKGETGSGAMSSKRIDLQQWAKERYRRFNEKIDFFKEDKNYSWLREYADDAIKWNSSMGFYQIKASDFIKRIECMPLDYIKDWLYGKNGLEWKPEFVC